MTQLMKVKKELDAHNPLELTPAQRVTLEESGIIPKGCPSHIVGLFGEMCSRQGVDPFSQIMHIVPYNSYNKQSKTWEKTYTIITGIHVLEQRAESTGAYAGEDEVRFDDNLTPYQAVKRFKKTGEYPSTATAKVYKLVQGQRVPYTGTVVWDEFAQVSTRRDSLGELSGNWKSKPFFMFEKCARATALRRAFPKQLEGLFTSDEIGAYGENLATVSDIKTYEESREEMISRAKSLIKACKTGSDFNNLFEANPDFEEVPEIVQALQDRKNYLKEQFVSEVKDLVSNCSSLEQLENLYDSNPAYERVEEVKEVFSTRYDDLYNNALKNEGHAGE